MSTLRRLGIGITGNDGDSMIDDLRRRFHRRVDKAMINARIDTSSWIVPAGYLYRARKDILHKDVHTCMHSI
jgi:hypothetical protein